MQFPPSHLARMADRAARVATLRLATARAAAQVVQCFYPWSLRHARVLAAREEAEQRMERAFQRYTRRRVTALAAIDPLSADLHRALARLSDGGIAYFEYWS
jgi:hypothetical protein